MGRTIANIGFWGFIKYLVRWALMVIAVAVAIGAIIALFLWLLHWAILFRFAHTWLLFLLPLAGVVIHFAYRFYGKSAEKGNNLVIDEIHQPGAGIPKRLAPLILITTVVTHLFGGSAGREGTAVQIGGSLAHLFGSIFKLNANQTQTLLTAGVAAGFGAVFGTPLTGAIFAVEVLTLGRISYKPLVPCLLAAFVGDVTVSVLQIKHTVYHIGQVPLAAFGQNHLIAFITLILKVILASILFGFVAIAFADLTHRIKTLCLKWIKISWLIPVLGGLGIIALTFMLGKPDYLSLGVDAEHPGAVTIVSAFAQGGADFFSWFWKLIYTAITLGTGFKGGEVTPLFFIGATLGNTLAGLLNAPVSLFAALGFIAVFAGATNTPLACTLMGIELFGGDYAVFFAVACFTAYFFSGHKSIYPAQYRGLKPHRKYMYNKLRRYRG